MILAKCRDHLFVGSEYIIEAFCSLLRRDLKESYKSKGNSLVSVLATNLLLFAFRVPCNFCSPTQEFQTK
jgi:integrator complex subunit 1